MVRASSLSASAEKLLNGPLWGEYSEEAESPDFLVAPRALPLSQTDKSSQPSRAVLPRHHRRPPIACRYVGDLRELFRPNVGPLLRALFKCAAKRRLRCAADRYRQRGHQYRPQSGDERSKSLQPCHNERSVCPWSHSPPPEFTLGLDSTKVTSPGPIAIDSASAAWMVNVTRAITNLSSAGAVLSESNCFTGGGLAAAYAIALDDSGNAWVTSTYLQLAWSNSQTPGCSFRRKWLHRWWSRQRRARSPWMGPATSEVTNDENSIVKLSSSGTPLSGSTGFTSPGFAVPDADRDRRVRKCMGEDEQLAFLLAHRVFVTNHPKDFRELAAIHESSITRYRAATRTQPASRSRYSWC
jgi:hypothetical protein